MEIIWLIRGAESSDPRYRSFGERLRGVGISVQWVTLPEGLPNRIWIDKFIPLTCHYLFFSDDQLPWVSERIEAIKSVFLDRAFTCAWVHENLSPAGLETLMASSVDEVVSVMDPAKELRSRLALRLQHSLKEMQLQRQLKESSQREAKTETMLKQREEFLSVCAHDLRSPLGLIQSSLAMLLNGKKDLTEFDKELLVRAKRQSEHGIRLVNDLLDVMAYEQGLRPDYQIVELDGFLKEIHKDYQFHAEQKKVRLHFENAVAGWSVLIDPDRVRQLFQNLIVNAIKFTETGKSIYLNVMAFQGRRKTDPPYPMIIVSLRDEGKGIPSHQIDKIFNRFSQVKDYGREQGRGLGLTVAKQISNLHDGNIWVQSVEGEGSTFFVLFPHVISQSVSQPEPTGLPRKRVLVAEPSLRNRESYFEIMGRWGYEPIFAKDGVEAVTLAFHQRPEMVILTQGLSKIDEEQVAHILKSDPRTTDISIVCSSAIGWPGNKKAQDLPYDSLLKLPFTREAFQIALDSVNGNRMKRQRKAA